jgi:hypothetical protein
VLAASALRGPQPSGRPLPVAPHVDGEGANGPRFGWSPLLSLQSATAPLDGRTKIDLGFGERRDEKRKTEGERADGSGGVASRCDRRSRSSGWGGEGRGTSVQGID